MGKRKANPGGVSTVFVVSTADIATVQGSTEAHYIARSFARDFDTHVFAPLTDDVPGATSHAHPFDGIVGVLLLNLLYFPYWGYVGYRYDPDVVYCYSNALTPALLLGRLCGATTIHDFQDDPSDQIGEFARTTRGPGSFSYLGVLSYFAALSRYAHMLALREIDAVITLSEPLKAQISRRYRIPSEKIRVVPLGVDTDVFRPLEETASNDDSTLRVAYVGTIRSSRGLNHVIEAMSMLDGSIAENVTFEVFGSPASGDAPIMDELRAQVEAAGLSEQVIWHGYVPHEEIPKTVARCDLAVSPLPPLRSYRVSCPAKIFEYLAMGLPVVATRIEPHERFLTDGEDAMLVPPEDPASIAAALTDAFEDRARLEAMSENARRTALDHDWQTRYGRILDTIQTNSRIEPNAA